MAWLPDGEALAAREQLKALMTAIPFTSCVPFSDNTPLAEASRQRTGVLFRAAAQEAPAEETLAHLERILGLNGLDTLRYADKKKGQRRTVRLHRTGLQGEQAELQLAGFVLAGDTSAQAWITTLLKDQLPAQAYGRLLLSAGAKPPVAVQSLGTLVCSCLNVTDLAIDAHLLAASQNGGDLLSDEARLASLQATLKCGSNCGSCLPELKRRVRLAKAGQTAALRSVIPINQLA